MVRCQMKFYNIPFNEKKIIGSIIFNNSIFFKWDILYNYNQHIFCTPNYVYIWLDPCLCDVHRNRKLVLRRKKLTDSKVCGCRCNLIDISSAALSPTSVSLKIAIVLSRFFRKIINVYIYFVICVHN